MYISLIAMGCLIISVLAYNVVVAQSTTSRVYEKTCTLNALEQFNIKYSCPTEQVIVYDWEKLSDLDKTAIDFILSTNGYRFVIEDITTVENPEVPTNSTEVKIN